MAGVVGVVELGELRVGLVQGLHGEVHAGEHLGGEPVLGAAGREGGDEADASVARVAKGLLETAQCSGSGHVVSLGLRGFHGTDVGHAEGVADLGPAVSGGAGLGDELGASGGHSVHAFLKGGECFEGVVEGHEETVTLVASGGQVCNNSYMTNRTAELEAKAAASTKAQSTTALINSLKHLEEIAPEPAHPEMPQWSKVVDWVEAELIERLGCEKAHTDWVLSDEFEQHEGRTSYAFLARVAGQAA